MVIVTMIFPEFDCFLFFVQGAPFVHRRHSHDEKAKSGPAFANTAVVR